MRALIATLILVSIPALADASSTMRCGSQLVSLGDVSAQVLLKCGEPLTRERVAVETSGTTDELVELWTYDLGPGQFMKMLRFEGGKLASIEAGERQ